MNKKVLTIFDFDGTLYPINPYDSEHLLLLANAERKGREFKQHCIQFIEQDQHHEYNDQSFHKHYETLVEDSTNDMIEEVAKSLSASVSLEEKDALLKLSEISDLGILSCGTDNIAIEFLRALGLLEIFTFVKAKHLVLKENRKANLQILVAGPDHKASLLDSERKKYETIIAVGDGPTDLPMLGSADLGLIINRNQTKTDYPFESHPDLMSIVKRVTSYLESATLA